MAEKEEKPIRVVDRRMFTPDGELRPGFEPEDATPDVPPPAAAPAPATPPPASPAASAAAPREAVPSAPAPASPEFPEEGLEDLEEPPEQGASGPQPTGEFTAIVRSLATTAYSALGLLADPTGARHPEPAVARQMIDWLSVLESKTRNNLSFEESDFLARVLYELRLAFVEVTRPAPR